MRLWLLSRKGTYDGDWSGHKDIERMIVRAESVSQARELAVKQTRMSDTRPTRKPPLDPMPVNPWKNADLTSCDELTGDGPAEVLTMQGIGYDPNAP